MDVRMVGEVRRAGYVARRLAEFAGRCREGGLAVTPQRLAIIRALLASAEHPRAEAVYEIVRREHPHISLATVHRTLETMCEIGEARKVTMLHDSARYDGNLTPHHHVVCVRCRRVRDVEIPELEGLFKERTAIGEFKVLGSTLEILALCSRCADNSKTHGAKPRRALARRPDMPRQRGRRL